MEAFKGKRVLVTGHTGFKGSWLTIWLQELGAEVAGFSLPPSTTPNNFELCGMKERMTHYEGDVRDLDRLTDVIAEFSPDIIFHLAAQPIVYDSFTHPQGTFATNALGTVNLLEAVRHLESVQAVVCITSDKCYENVEWSWGYRENDRLGGTDPYSASKAMAETAIHSYRNSFFLEGTAIASARAGNVIGGGDFSPYRLLPDCMRALIDGQPIAVRNPVSVRPWLFVLEPLAGYLCIAAKLLEDRKFATAWNFGPKETRGVPVKEMVEKVVECWGSGEVVCDTVPEGMHETGMLRLSWEKACHQLGWEPLYSWEDAISETVEWYKGYQEGVSIHTLCTKQIRKYMHLAQENDVWWAQQTSDEFITL